MPRTTMQLEEQLSDARSNEVAYRLKIENLGSSALNLLTLTPRIPEGVELIKVKDSSVEAAKVRHEAVCKALTELLSDRLFLSSKEVQNQILAIQKEQLRESIEDLQYFWKAYFKLLTGIMFHQQ